MRAIYALIAGLMMRIAVIPIMIIFLSFQTDVGAALGLCLKMMINAFFQGPILGLFTWLVSLLFRKINLFIIAPIFLFIITYPYYGLFTGHPLSSISYIEYFLEIIVEGIAFAAIFKWSIQRRLLLHKTITSDLVDTKTKM
jgi:hypothetical protein